MLTEIKIIDGEGGDFLKLLAVLNSAWSGIKFPTGKTLRVLDLGCGECKLSKEFISYQGSTTIVGVDVKRNFLDKAHEVGFLNSFIQGDMVSVLFGLADNCFDIILFMDSLEHINKADGFMMLVDAGRVATTAIMVFAPEGKCVRNTGPEEDHHKATWIREDFIKVGFQGITVLQDFHSEIGGKDALICVKYL